MEKIRYTFLIVMFFLIFLFLFNLIFYNNFSMQFMVFDSHLRDYMADFTNMIKFVSQNNPYQFSSNIIYSGDHAYPPLVYVFFSIFYKIVNGNGDYITCTIMLCHYVMFLITSFLLLTLYNGFKTDNLFKNLFMICIVFSGIFLYSWERGNMITLSAACITFFLFNYKSEKKYIRELSLIALSISCVLKILPALLAIFLLYDKRWKDFFKVVVYSILLFFIPFIYFEGGFNCFPILIKNMEINTNYYLFKRIPSFYILSFNLPLLIFTKWLYIKLSFIISVLAIATNFSHTIKWKQTAQIILSIYAIFSSSFLYVMLYFFPFIIMFFNKKEVEKDDWIYLLLFILILNPFQITNSTGYVINGDLIKISSLILLICLTKESILKTIELIKNKKLN